MFHKEAWSSMFKRDHEGVTKGCHAFGPLGSLSFDLALRLRLRVRPD
jgi:hypothetical protein